MKTALLTLALALPLAAHAADVPTTYTVNDTALKAAVAAPRASARPGDLDRSFRGTGIARTRIQRISDADCLVQQADGKLVVAGSSEGAPPFTETLVRYRANGRLDRSFGGAV